MQKYPVEIVGYGVNDGILQQVDPTHDAARLSIRPLEHVIAGMIGGHYAMVATYSNTAAKPAAGSDVFSMRWTDSRFYFVLLRLTAFNLVTTAYTAAGAQDLSLYVARDFSVSPSAGTQVIPLAGGQVVRSGNMKKTGLDGSSGVLWVSSGDLLTTGTRTLDTQPIGYFQYANPAGVRTVGIAAELSARLGGACRPRSGELFASRLLPNRCQPIYGSTLQALLASGWASCIHVVNAVPTRV